MDTTVAPLASIGFDIGKEVSHLVGFGTDGKIAFRVPPVVEYHADSHLTVTCQLGDFYHGGRLLAFSIFIFALCHGHSHLGSGRDTPAVLADAISPYTAIEI